jgi:hypothetical protein
MSYGTMRLQGADFDVLPLNHVSYLTGPVVYVLGRRDPWGAASALYVGETSEASGYLGSNHHKWDRAQRLGMNEVAIHRLPDRQRRLNLETVLRQQYRPPLNDQSVPSWNKAIVDALGASRSPLGESNPIGNALAIARKYAPPNNALVNALLRRS